ncbi:hypothetical protein CC78DRAFT_576407 [Lojkania enalia]|uniref:Phytase-like domain-containing protein n=1 Tax=Lojkania enalia TaxID=147567 RepID=A0A9P4KJ20_9PLEO|nr:hypothetical protein CC78DRAFT_576407 [Didymosphaeria enalia]
MPFLAFVALLSLLQLGCVAATPVARGHHGPFVNQTVCNGKEYVYEELAGWGLLPSDARDKFGETIGGIGSSIALDKTSWKRKKGSTEAYEGIIYGLPDRGWSSNGTQNTQNRIHKFRFTLDIVSGASKANPAPPNFKIAYLDTILLFTGRSTPTTGLDADARGSFYFSGFAGLPVATYPGDGFGGPGPGGKRMSLDAESLVLGRDGSFWIGDEYGPNIYQFNKRGKLVHVIYPPDAFVPFRNGTQSFNSLAPPVYDQYRMTIPEIPEMGRVNNQGFEAITASPNGKFLYAMLQSATVQDSGDGSPASRRNTRLLKYDLRKVGKGRDGLVGEYVVQLPLIGDQLAAQSEIHFISEDQFLVLSRDSDRGKGQEETESKYRNVDVFDISRATNVKGKRTDSKGGQVAPGGELKAGIKPAKYCPWLSYNNNDQLNRFGLHNGGPQDSGLLNEKWESLALGPIDKKFAKHGSGKEYYLISVSDNDFVTQNGFLNRGKKPYADMSGFRVDTQVLVFKVRLPEDANPL